LDKSIKTAGIGGQIDSVKIIDRFIPVAQKFFGPGAINKLKPLSLKNGTLTVNCLSSVFAQQLKADEARILAELNRPYRKKIVERLRFLV